VNILYVDNVDEKESQVKKHPLGGPLWLSGRGIKKY
jgi:hypothetical protein